MDWDQPSFHFHSAIVTFYTSPCICPDVSDNREKEAGEKQWQQSN
jgi:hypothetical protein